MSAYAFPAVDYGAAQSLIATFLDQARRLNDQPFLWSKADGVWSPQTYVSVAEESCAIAHGLIDEGVKPGDRVVLAAENRPEWIIADLGVLACGAITAPAYTSYTESDHLFILDNVDAGVVIASGPDIIRRVMPAAMRAKRRPLVVALDAVPPAETIPDGLRVVSWADLLARGEGKDEPEAMHKVGLSDLACIIHTSGTGGTPKGVMLSNRAILHNCMGAYHLLETIGLQEERFLSFLPLCHSYEHTTGLFFPVTIGAQVYFAESVDKLAANMAEVHPTIMTVVPRLFEVLRMRILRGISQQKPFSQKMFWKAVDLGRKRQENPRAMKPTERLMDFALDSLVRRKVGERMGGSLKALVSGGGPLNPEVGQFFRALGVPVLQGYGLTETAPVVACNMPYDVDLRTVGPAFKGVEVKTAEDGELLVRGPLLMDGYWQDEESTKATIDPEGWLHTGDVGVIDDKGFIRITDRKKDIIVNSGGHNISPQKVEGVLGLEPEIGQAVVFGDNIPHLVALIVPDAAFLTTWARENGKPNDLSRLAEDGELRVVIGAALDRCNAKLGMTEKVRRFAILPEPFSVENDQMTPTLKARRHIISQAYKDLLADLMKGK